MAIERYRRTQGGDSVRTTQCALCGAKKGDKWKHFAWHLASEHGPEDVSPQRGERA